MKKRPVDVTFSGHPWNNAPNCRSRVFSIYNARLYRWVGPKLAVPLFETDAHRQTEYGCVVSFVGETITSSIGHVNPSAWENAGLRSSHSVPYVCSQSAGPSTYLPFSQASPSAEWAQHIILRLCDNWHVKKTLWVTCRAVQQKRIALHLRYLTQAPLQYPVATYFLEVWRRLVQNTVVLLRRLLFRRSWSKRGLGITLKYSSMHNGKNCESRISRYHPRLARGHRFAQGVPPLNRYRKCQRRHALAADNTSSDWRCATTPTRFSSTRVRYLLHRALTPHPTCRVHVRSAPLWLFGARAFRISVYLACTARARSLCFSLKRSHRERIVLSKKFALAIFLEIALRFASISSRAACDIQRVSISR